MRLQRICLAKCYALQSCEIASCFELHSVMLHQPLVLVGLNLSLLENLEHIDIVAAPLLRWLSTYGCTSLIAISLTNASPSLQINKTLLEQVSVLTTE